MRQLYRAHALLFACAYAGFLGYSAATDPNDPVVALFRANARASERSQAPAAAPVAARDAPADAIPAEEHNVSSAAVPRSVAVSDEPAGQEERARMSQVRLQATSGKEPQERAQAIDQLNAATPETLQTLQAVVTSDSAARNRIRALNSLRVLAEQDGARDVVVSIVHLAMMDANASVASRAKQVYRELTQAQAPGE